MAWWYVGFVLKEDQMTWKDQPGKECFPFWLLSFLSACMAGLKAPSFLQKSLDVLSGASSFANQYTTKPWHAGKHIQLQLVQTLKCFRGCSIYEVIFLESQNTHDIFQSPDNAFRRHY